jgi:hypothetical protein
MTLIDMRSSSIGMSYYTLEPIYSGSLVNDMFWRFFVLTRLPDSQYCTLLVTIIVVNTMMIDIHANMRNR